MRGRKAYSAKTAAICIVFCALSFTAAAQSGTALSKMNFPLVTRLSSSLHSSSNAKATRATKKADSRIALIIETASGADIEDLLATYKARKVSSIGNLCIITMPQGRAMALAADNRVKRMECYNKKTVLDNDVTASAISADKTWTGQGLPQAYTGKGVVVGIEDISFDFTHPTFLDSAGNTRICRFWEQYGDTVAGGSVPWGHEIKKDDILSTQHSLDSASGWHGTHVLGTAAGSGDIGNAGKWCGMAPQADIIATDIFYSSNAKSLGLVLKDSDAQALMDAGLSDCIGFKYIFDAADEMNEPCVVNFSASSYWNFFYDNDTSLEEKYINKMLETPGHILVASAGNAGAYTGYYLRADASDSVKARLLFYSIASPSKTYGLSARSKGKSVFKFRLNSNGQVVIPSDSIPPYNSGSIKRDTFYLARLIPDTPDSCNVLVRAYKLEMPDKMGYNYKYYFVVCAGKNTINSEIDRNVTLTACTSDEGDLEIKGEYFNCRFFDDDNPTEAIYYGYNPYSIGTPGGYDKVVCVGATQWRYSFTNLDGDVKGDLYSDTPLQQRVAFSSIGPTVDGLLKPDVCAPGVNVISSMNSFYPDSDNNESVNYADKTIYNGKDYYWGGDMGTSMSAPAVTGTIALWLEANPNLTTEQVKKIIAETSTHSDTTLSYPNYQYGYGEINAYEGLLKALDLQAKVPSISTSQPRSAAFSLNGKTLNITLASGQPQTFIVRIYTTAGVKVMQSKFTSVTSATLSLDSLPAGVYAVQVTGDTSVTGSTLIRL